jgi:hypothetical protein
VCGYVKLTDHGHDRGEVQPGSNAVTAEPGAALQRAFST